MSEGRVERKLLAILAADVVGYSRLMAADEEGTLAAVHALWRDLVDPKMDPYRGRIVKTIGDGLLVEFQSVVDALRCAVEIQREMAERNKQIASERRIEFRIGIHQGDIIAEDGDIFGDGVNVAARLEALAKPGGICVSERVQEDTAGRLDLVFDDLGLRTLKNIPRPIRLFHVNSTAGSTLTTAAPGGSPDKPRIDRLAAGTARPLFARAFGALVLVVVIYVLSAKAFGVFLGHLHLFGIWVAAISVAWLIQRLIAGKRDYTDSPSAPSKPAVPAGKGTR
jgi:class 3 adenylate cyclase